MQISRNRKFRTKYNYEWITIKAQKNYANARVYSLVFCNKNNF